ncbi:exonuclease of the beta-lactamase [Candidatus Scalindua japonica]|uniref:Exonuclease of the beta-lactamase n=1 Tax=Candidatus Scalindua japonica TaxID=1284222 RepID=A0A286U367_9BACT|nr:hypothetical protein [Candidatus Scalindua japonica]GAX62576.1 exonuclease of the beta-lactamase [Candidatus Scalindua japonica]
MYLRKSILPIVVADGVSDDRLPPVLSKIQYVDYRNQDQQSILAINKAINNIPVSQPFPVKKFTLHIKKRALLWSAVTVLLF